MALPSVPDTGSKVAIAVNVEACTRLSRLLRVRDIPLDREETDLHMFSRIQAGNFYFWLVAICHQTSPQGLLPLVGNVNGRELRGWDYLFAKFQLSAIEDPQLLLPARWAVTTGDDLQVLFHDSVTGDRLTEPEARSALLRSLGGEMISAGWNSLEDLYRLSQRRIAIGQPNLLGLLAKFRAYDDPVRKKSYFLLSLMRNTGLWEYVDGEHLGPPVDYHEVRGHLRIGTVTITDDRLTNKLLRGEPVTYDEDIAIRQAVHDAIMFLSNDAGLKNPSQLHYLFWNVFRSCCSRDVTHCFGCPPDCSLPARYIPLAIHADGGRRCPFAEVCDSAGKNPKLRDHVFTTDYY